MEILQDEGKEGQEFMMGGAILRDDLLEARAVGEQRIREELARETEAERQQRLWSEANALARM